MLSYSSIIHVQLCIYLFYVLQGFALMIMQWSSFAPNSVHMTLLMIINKYTYRNQGKHAFIGICITLSLCYTGFPQNAADPVFMESVT